MLSREGYNGEHAPLVNNNGNPTIEDVLVVGENILIPCKKGMEIIDLITDKCEGILVQIFRQF